MKDDFYQTRFYSIGKKEAKDEKASKRCACNMSNRDLLIFFRSIFLVFILALPMKRWGCYKMFHLLNKIK